MGGALSSENWQVSCASGWTYAERPVALLHVGLRLEIERVEAMWRGPDGRHFTVQAQDLRRFHLLYQEDLDAWSVEAA